jgi:hypothetical protein
LSLLLEDEPEPDGLLMVLEPLPPEDLSSVEEPLDEEPLEDGLELVPEPIVVDGLVLELLPESVVLEDGLVVELLPAPIVLEPEPLPVEGEAAVEPVRLFWSSVELVLPAAYASDATPIIKTAAKLVSVNFRIKISSD